MKTLNLICKAVLDTIATGIIMFAAMGFAGGVGLIGTVLWTELSKDPTPLYYVGGVVGGLVGFSASLAWAWTRMNRETP